MTFMNLPMDVLVVDDDPMATSMIEFPLRQCGYRVHTASHGRDALRVLRELPIQLVLSDWTMPEMNGIELCHEIRKSSASRYIYFIMVTSHAGPGDAICGFEGGVDDYIMKPFNTGELVMRVNAGRRIIQLETSNLAIFALAKLAESRDTDTGQHLERVRSFCRSLAIRLRDRPKYRNQIDDDFVRLIYATSPLHDIGKVAIPDFVLLKPGKLTPEEFEIMKTHTLRGAETLQAALAEFPNAGFLRMATAIALSHHERYDGKGYPHGLAGEDIPLCARIVAVADVYDALTSKRVYKEAFAHSVAIETISTGRGTQFDPEVVDAFLETTEEFLEVRRIYDQSTFPLSVAANPMSALTSTLSQCLAGLTPTAGLGSGVVLTPPPSC